MGSDKIHRIIINFKLGNDTKTSRRATIGSTSPFNIQFNVKKGNRCIG